MIAPEPPPRLGSNGTTERRRKGSTPRGGRAGGLARALDGKRVASAVFVPAQSEFTYRTGLRIGPMVFVPKLEILPWAPRGDR